MRKRKPLFLFDQDDQFLDSLLNYTKPYITEEKGKKPIFEFIVPMGVEGIEHIKEEHHVVVKDVDGIFRKFIIKDLDENLDEIRVYCVSFMQELSDTLILDKRPSNVLAEDALAIALENTRCQVGQVASLGSNSSSFYRLYVTEAIDKIVGTWGGEVRDRVEFDESSLTGQYIDLLERRGADRGHRFEIGKDIKGVEIRIQSYPKTALYGWGAAIEYDTGGYSRKLDFADVEWSVENGDPVDKPLGQTWVGDPDALEKWGRLKDGQRIHREGKIEFFDTEDPEELLMQTWMSLQEQKDPNINVRMDVVLLGELAGFSHKKVRFGDTVRARIKELDFTAEMRVIKHRYNILDYSDALVEIGQPLKTNNNLHRLKKVESQLSDQPKKTTVTDDSFPDNVPPVPSNFRANGSFKIIQVLWDYDPSSYIAAYEVYASQVQGFTPDSSNLVWRGKSGGYNHNADTDQQWYFRIRAINTHGTPSDYSVEISAQTLQINADTDVQPLSITNQLIAENAAIDFAKIANVEITSAMIVNLVADKIKGGNFTGETFTGGRFEGTDFIGVNIEGSTIYSESSNGDYYTSIEGGQFQLKSKFIKMETLDGGIYFSKIEEDGSYSIPGRSVFISDGKLEVANFDAMTGKTDGGYLNWHTGKMDTFTIGSYSPNFDFRVYSPNHSGSVEENQHTRMRITYPKTLIYNDLDVSGELRVEGSRRVMVGRNEGTVDFNQITKPGVYRVSSGNTNAPPNHSYGQLLVMYGGGDTIAQIHAHYQGNYIYWRAGNASEVGGSGTYRSWRQFIVGDSSGRVDSDLEMAPGNYVLTNAVDHNGVGDHMYIRPSSSGEVRATAVGTTTTYRPVRASSFPTSSLAEMKQDIEEYQGSAIDVIMGTTLYQYRLKDDVENDIDKLRVGAVIGKNYQVSEEIIDEHGEGVEQYLMNSFSWKAIQELYLITQDQSTDIQDLTHRVEALESKVA